MLSRVLQVQLLLQEVGFFANHSAVETSSRSPCHCCTGMAMRLWMGTASTCLLMCMHACIYRGASAVRKLCRVLDDMHAAGAKLGDRYFLESGEDRLVGSQGVVQFATLPRTMVRRFYSSTRLLHFTHGVCGRARHTVCSGADT